VKLIGKVVAGCPTRRIPVRIHIDEVPEDVLISSGMTATVVLEGPSHRPALSATLHLWLAPVRSKFDA
jgi:hypothetical protein